MIQTYVICSSFHHQVCLSGSCARKYILLDSSLIDWSNNATQLFWYSWFPQNGKVILQLTENIKLKTAHPNKALDICVWHTTIYLLICGGWQPYFIFLHQSVCSPTHFTSTAERLKKHVLLQNQYYFELDFILCYWVNLMATTRHYIQTCGS